MKIAITGHKHGIGKAFAQQLADRGHEIIGISRSDGENIRRIEHTANIIDPCTLFINNAQSYYAQTELLYAVWKRWYTLAGRHYIWNISSKISIIRPGAVDTSDIKKEKSFKKSCAERPEKADVNVWVKSVIDTFTQHQNIHVSELSIGHTIQRIPL